MADFSLPTITSLYTAVISLFKARDDDLARQMRTDVAAPTNMPDQSIRWNAANFNWEEFSAAGPSWGALASTYGIDVDQLDGQHGAYYLDWPNLTNIPATFAPSSHSHDFGTLPSSPNGVLQLMRGTTAQMVPFTGALAEITYDTDKKTLVVHDGATAGGLEIALKSSVDINASNIATNTGNISANAGNISTNTGNIATNVSNINLKAPIANPTFTGTPIVPTAAAGTNTTQAASTQFVKTEIGGKTISASAPSGGVDGDVWYQV